MDGEEKKSMFAERTKDERLEALTIKQMRGERTEGGKHERKERSEEGRKQRMYEGKEK